MTSASFVSAPFNLLRRFLNGINLPGLSSYCGRTPPSPPPDAWTVPSLGNRVFSGSARARETASLISSDSSAEPSPKPEPPKEPSLRERYPRVDDEIHRLLINPVLYDPVRRPRFPIVLCHGLYGFDVRGPSSFPKLQMHYWNNVLAILRQRIGAEVIVTSVSSTGSVVERARDLDKSLRNRAYGRGINFMAHSMGGLDCRYLISRIKPTDYTPLSLTTISTPHRGSPFMDWCEENLGLGRIPTDTKATTTVTETTRKATDSDALTETKTKVETKIESSSLSASLASLPASFTTFLLSILDSPAYANLTTSFCNDTFNAQTPDDPNVRYFSIAGRAPSVNIWHPFWFPKMVVDAWERKERKRLADAGHPDANNPSEWGNDGLVTIRSARWGEFLGTMEGCDHWEIRGARGIELDIDIPALQSVSLSIPSVSLRDWDLTSWLSAWRKDSDDAKAQKAKVEEETGEVQAVTRKANVEVERTTRTVSGPKEPENSAEQPKVASSTERLSTVFDWVAEHTPIDAITKASARVTGNSGVSAQDLEAAAQGTNRKGERNELATKADLERFYVALCRKLYDEGL